MKAIVLAGLGVCVACPAIATEPECKTVHCEHHFHLQSVSETKRYGLLLEAPASDCLKVRYRVLTDAAVFLGHTPPLSPGEIAVVRMGRGFVEGDHLLTIAAEGCAVRPGTARRVTLAKPSPDHGWRAAKQRQTIISLVADRVTPG